MENSGQIPYLDLLVSFHIGFRFSVMIKLNSFQRISEEEHFNPGKFFEDVRGFYSTETTDAHRMFMKPISNSKFDVWDPENVVLFYKEAPVGKNKVAITQEETELTELFTDRRGCEFLL